MTASSGRQLEGLAILVSGGASGIGAATAEMCANRGAHVTILDLQPHPDLPSILTDVADTGQVNRAVSAAASSSGVDGLVNCAGIGAVGTVEECDDETWTRLLEVNVMGVVRLTRAALPFLRASKSPSIVNVASIAATAGLPRRAAYSASKGAVQSLTLAMAADYVCEGIRVNAVNPGTVDTPWIGRLLAASHEPDALRRELEARQPTGRLVAPEEVAEAICLLLTPHASSITGSVLAVDGGMSGLRLPPESST